MAGLHTIHNARAGTLKILLVTEDLPSQSPGGLAQHVLTLAAALQRDGHQVDIIGSTSKSTSGKCFTPFPSFCGNFFSEIPPTRGWKEKQLGTFVPMKRYSAAKKLSEIIIRHANNYDVVHYHGHMPDVAMFLPVDTRFLQTRHDQGSECLTHTRFKQGTVCRETAPESCASCITNSPNPIQKAISKFSVQLFRKNVARAFSKHPVIFVSNSLRINYARTMGGNPDEAGKVIHNHIDQMRILENIRINSKNIEENQPPMVSEAKTARHVFIAGKIYPEKGILEFIQLMRSALPPDMHISIAGDGPEEQYLREHCIHERISVLGWCAYDQVIQMASAADIIVVPSVCEESCPTTIHEALFLGKPTLALRRGGTPELAQYERYPGQLMLFDDLRSLTQFLQQSPPSNNMTAPAANHVYGAEISKLLPYIVDQYRLQQSKARIT